MNTHTNNKDGVPCIEITDFIIGVIAVLGEVLDQQHPSATTHAEDALNVTNILIRGSTNDIVQLAEAVATQAETKYSLEGIDETHN